MGSTNQNANGNSASNIPGSDLSRTMEVPSTSTLSHSTASVYRYPVMDDHEEPMAAFFTFSHPEASLNSIQHPSTTNREVSHSEDRPEPVADPRVAFSDEAPAWEDDWGATDDGAAAAMHGALGRYLRQYSLESRPSIISMTSDFSSLSAPFSTLSDEIIIVEGGSTEEDDASTSGSVVRHSVEAEPDLPWMNTATRTVVPIPAVLPHADDDTTSEAESDVSETELSDPMGVIRSAEYMLEEADRKVEEVFRDFWERITPDYPPRKELNSNGEIPSSANGVIRRDSAFDSNSRFTCDVGGGIVGR